MNKWIRNTIIVVVVGVIAFFGYRFFTGDGFAGGPPNANGANEEVEEFTTVFTGDLSSGATAAGQLIAQREADLALQTTGTVAMVNVQVGDNVSAGDVLVQLDTTSLTRSILEAEQNLAVQEQNLAKLLLPAEVFDIASAEASLVSAQASLQDLLDGPSESEIASSEASVNAARADLASAQSRYSEVAAGGSQDEQITAEKALADADAAYKLAEEAHRATYNCDWNNDTQQFDCDPTSDDPDARAAAQQALADLTVAQERFNDLQPNNGGANLASQGATVASRRAALEAAEARHQKLLSGSTEEQIVAAEAQVAQAQATLDNLLEGATAASITRQEVAIENARITLERNQYALENATLVAPFDGIVTQVNTTPGEINSGIVVSLIDMGSLEIELDVDEVDIGAVSVGQDATVNFDAYRGVELPATIVSIAPINTQNTNGTVNYKVNLTFDNQDLDLLNGLTAEARLFTAEVNDALLVANRAIRADRENGTFFVDRVTGEDENGEPILEEVEVQIGLRDSANTQIVSGLDEGDEVAIGYIPPPTVQIGGPGDDN
ncbi:MAG: HlyD family efflux transporter periplasmic adaptor subunit [Chloroflexota bacterium]